MLQEIDADLHIHSRFAKACSPEITINAVAECARKKGLALVGTGDALHPDWLAEIKQMGYSDETGIFTHENGVKFILTGELEDRDSVHHLVIFPGLAALQDVKEKLENFSNNFAFDGRPKVGLSGEAIANTCLDSGCLFGPAHAFTPWTSVFKTFTSLSECYKSATRLLSFVELGLSADTYLADKVEELRAFVYLSGSDAHSANPARLGREFMRLAVKSVSFNEIELALKGAAERKIVFNAGVDPREGRYHCTACTKCYQKYGIDEARSLSYTCVSCGSIIKMGVKDRIEKLSGGAQSVSPPGRPPYQYTIPLVDLITRVMRISPAEAEARYNEIVSDYGTETKILFELKPEEISPKHPELADALQKFRDGFVVFVPGGGGRYGQVIIPRDSEEMKRIIVERASEINCVSGITQKSLTKFF
ncbi:MAG: endonuclease Q family protein [archaeon]